MSPPFKGKKQNSAGLRINISKLSEGIHNYEFNVDPHELDLDDRFNVDLDIKIRLDKSSNQIYLTALVDTYTNVECDRCLKDFYYHIQSNYSVLYTCDEHCIQNDEFSDLKKINIYQPYLDIIDDVREYVLLSIPVKLLCKEECLGLCPMCGKNLNHEKCDCKLEEEI